MNALVTGGGGFLGRYIVERLVARGDTVRILSRSRHSELSKLGVEEVCGDLRDRDLVCSACQNIETVFHVAAKIDHWGRWRDFYDSNVQGTHNLLHGCKTHSVGRLVYTSSPSVVFDNRDLCDVDESQPYPRKYNSFYAETKSIAEQLVLQANQSGLRTAALRPHLIWGPRDNHLIPGIIENARNGRLRMIGKKDVTVDFTHVENVADAHLLAADRLVDNPRVQGQVFFISQNQPVGMWSFVNQMLVRLGIPQVTKRVPTAMAKVYAHASELFYRSLPVRGQPRVTRFLAAQLTHSHHFNISKAIRELGYQPKVSMNKGLDDLVAFIRNNGGDPLAVSVQSTSEADRG